MTCDDHDWEIVDCPTGCGDDNCTVMCRNCDEYEAACEDD